MIPIPDLFLRSNLEQKNKKCGLEAPRGFSNQTFAQLTPSLNLANIFIPAYLRIKLKNIKCLSLQDFDSELNLTINLDIYVRQVPIQLLECLRQKLVLNFSRNDPTILSQSKTADLKIKEKFNKNKQLQYLNFTVRKILKAKVEPFIFFTPLQLLDLVLTIYIRPIRYQQQCGQQNGQIKFLAVNMHINFMGMDLVGDDDSKQIQCLTKEQLQDNNLSQEQKRQIRQQFNIQVCMSHSENTVFGKYRLANKRMWPQYSNSMLSKDLIELERCFYSWKYISPNSAKTQSFTKEIENEDSSNLHLSSFNFSHFHIPLYKDPWVSLLVIYLPLMILGVINMSIFFQDNALSDRLANIATLLIAIVGMIELIRDQIPPSPLITLTQIMVLLQSLACMMCLLSSVFIRNFWTSQQFQAEYTLLLDFPFWIATILTTIVIAVPCLMIIMYVKKLHKSFEKLQIADNKRFKFRQQWKGNLQADKLFYHYSLYFQKQQKYNCVNKSKFIEEDKSGVNIRYEIQEFMKSSNPDHHHTTHKWHSHSH